MCRPSREGSDEQLVRQLVDRARAEGLKLTGEDGLLGRLTKVVVESALEGEMDDCLGYCKHDPAGRNGRNSRNGTRPKTTREHHLLAHTLDDGELAELNRLLATLLARFETEFGCAPAHGKLREGSNPAGRPSDLGTSTGTGTPTTRAPTDR
jgi:Transposase, Mutator family